MFGKLCISTLLIATTLSAQNVFTIGTTYEFAEEDLIIAIKENIQTNEEAIKKRFADMKEKAQTNIDELSPTLSVRPSPAIENRTFYPDTTYVNPKDIRDHTGKILYPKGYTFNPMDYINLAYEIVVINGNRSEELDWIKSTDYLGTAAYRVLITEGKFKKVTEALGQTVFFATDQIINRLSIKKTPSVITQDGNRLKIKEIYVAKAKKNGEKEHD